MNLQMHPAYEQLIEKATRCHENNRNPREITAEDVSRARLYSYAFRLHVIGTFHATRHAIASLPEASTLSTVYRTHAIERLEDLANQTMDPVPRDFRAVISTLYRYHRNLWRVIDNLKRDYQEARDPQLVQIAERFGQIVQQITSGNGIHLTQDTEAPHQATFVVPNLGIIIVPLVYGDYHSWNLAYLAGKVRDAPVHRHYEGVEIHLGYNPTHGVTVLGDYRAPVEESYAEPIPPETDHGWINTSHEVHHVPFVFGSLKYGGWGVFFDVEPATSPLEKRSLVERDSTPFEHMVYLERDIAEAEAQPTSWRSTLIPHKVTNRRGVGGLELNLTRIDPAGYAFPLDDFRIVSVVRGQGVVSIEGIERRVGNHDHFGIPAGMQATMKQSDSAPLVVLDALIRG